jgi:hypothetical protein
MARSVDFAQRMRDDATMMSYLLGGVYTPDELELVGEDRITQDSAPDAFDDMGFLLPCALVVHQTQVPDGIIEDNDNQLISIAQRVEIWYYQDKGYSVIDLALERGRQLFQGYQFSGTYPVRLGFISERMKDLGSLKGASTVRQDWQVYEILGEE